MSEKNHTLSQSQPTSGSSPNKPVVVTHLEPSRISSSKQGKAPLPLAELKQMFKYDSNGFVVWAVSPTKGKDCQGKRPGTLHFGYRIIQCRRRGKIIRFSEHQIVWLLHYGYWPNYEIDHINGIRDDNRIENLREVTRRQNAKNTKMRTDNTSGVTGVYWHNKAQKWTASIKVGDKYVYLGLFETFEEAVAARKAAEVKYGYHSNHGRIAHKVLP